MNLKVLETPVTTGGQADFLFCADVDTKQNGRELVKVFSEGSRGGYLS
jgi:hypothetical protein